jgi:MSHA pilin protein MshC
MTRRAHAGAGFTMVELVTVIILVGVLGAVAATRFVGRTGFDARGFADQAQSLMRYAQKVAVAQNRPVYVRLDGASVALCFDNACSGAANQVIAPGGTNSVGKDSTNACLGSTNWACAALPANVTLTATGLGTSFYFDALGKPFMGTDAITAVTSTFPAPAAGASTATYLTIAGDGVSTKVYVEAETGYVHQ